MIAVSSLKPFLKDTEYANHQRRAFYSWVQHFDGITYMSDFEIELGSPVTRWVPCKGHAKIKDLVAIAAKQTETYVALINSDIYLHDRFAQVKKSMERNQTIAAVSKRYGYHHPDFNSAQIIDHGLDVFITTPRVWKKVYQAIPDTFWIGHYLWDTWMSGFLNTLLGSKVVDFTSYRCVFHPIHGGRETVHDSEIKANSRYLHRAGLPGSKLK